MAEATPVHEVEVDLGRMLAVLFAAWRRLALAGLLGGAVAAAGSLLLPNVYQGVVVLAPVKNDPTGGALGLRAQLGGLAALAGLDLGGAGGGSVEEYIASFTSDDFTRSFIVRENLLPVLFADEWDATAETWREPEDVPTLGDAIEMFHDEVRSINQDRKTGLVTLRVEWTDRELAARWANQMVEMINERLRNAAIDESKRRVEFLEGELAKTSVVELRQVIFNLIEGQVNAAMLANVQREYAFRVIDPAVTADEDRKVRPKRALLALGGAFLTGFALALHLLWRRRRELLVEPAARVIS